MGKYKSKPVEVEAFKLSHENAQELARWCGGRIVEEISPIGPAKIYVGLNIPTINGVVRASEGDYVIKDARGMFYVRKSYLFDEAYEEV